ncbi:transcriptional regulator with XRE-family HTH domain [Saccharopolyspora lacisalsi]|uniref:Transcriptional regulator with XRE-family HTH domain n=1 Tax=Halosaccharopolyspora lacisalsi TaxID=1000566 RepID=A0A839DSR2_9PSEU|nr:XRE family transcriptional regulator [Halosaccharopolyspora lacisalsi]MBA8823306.1 transcriptional regulator with XRE-family HTH domain [Halosaccharopolyspora lacisalsi]
MSESHQHKRSFSDKLAHLIATVHPPDRGAYSYREIEAGIRHHAGAMTAAYINQLAKGKQPFPRIHHVEALADFFGVPASYFLDEEVAERVDAQIGELVRYADDETRNIAERVMTLDARGRRTVSNLVDTLHSYEQQPRERRGRRKPGGDET